MANLLEALQPQMQDTTSQLSTLLRAKTGKAGAAPTGTTSTQQEQAAVAQTAQAMEPVKQAAATQQVAQEQQAREIVQKTQQQQAQIQQQRQANAVQTQLRTNELLQGLEQGKGRIDLARYQAGLEQVGQNLRLSNQQYIDNLQREGARARLNVDLQFKEQLARATLEDNKQLLEKQLGNKSILAASDREFSKRMAEMGLNSAWEMFRNDAKAAKDTAVFTGIGGLITTGIGAYGTYEDAQEKKALRQSVKNQELAMSRSNFYDEN
jgi:hypothetical protein